MTPILRLNHRVRRKVMPSGNDLFLCSIFCIAPQENGQYRRGKVTWQDSPNAAWCLSPPQAARRQFDEKLWGGKNAPKFDKQQQSAGTTPRFARPGSAGKWE